MTMRNVAGVLAAAVPLFVSSAALAATPTLKIKLKHNTQREQQTKEEVERLAARYDLKKFTLTRDIMIEQGAMAHSHPVLTMNCRFLRDDDLLLSQYLHEQGHWVLLQRHRHDMPRLLRDLKGLLPGLPTAYPQGGFDEQGTYVHVAVNLLEWQALEEVIGPERARRVMEWKRGDHYTAIYSAVLENREQLERVLQKYDIKF